MRKLSKILTIILCLIISCSSLFACHGKRADEVEESEVKQFEVPETFDTSKTYTISFWAKNDTNKTQVSIYEKAKEDFQKLYPNIKVNIKYYTDYRRIYSDVITNISTKTTPNVCITYPDHIATYITGEDTVVPLDNLISNTKYGFGGTDVNFDSPTKDQIVSKFLSECIIDDTYYALPFMRSTEACYVNKTYVEALGYTLPEVITWDFIWEVSEKAMEKDESGKFKINGQEVLIPFIYKSTDNMMIQIAKQKDIPYCTEDGDILLFNDQTKLELEQVAKEVGLKTFSTFAISSYPGNFFNAGQCIFAVDSTAGATWMGTHAPNTEISDESLVDFETVVYPCPQADVDNIKMISQGPSICLFNKDDPQEVLASWLFAQFLLTNETQINYASTEGYVPVTTKAQQSTEYLDYLSRSGEDNEYYYSIKIDATKILIDNVDKTFVTPVFNGSASLREAAGELIEQTALGVRRKKEINDEFYSNIYSNVISLYRLDQLGDNGSKKAEFGKLPTFSLVILITLVVVWVGIIAYLVYTKVKNKKKPIDN